MPCFVAVEWGNFIDAGPEVFNRCPYESAAIYRGSKYVDVAVLKEIDQYMNRTSFDD